jgi:predicted acylesterase/phospholipase RssA
MEPSKTKKCYGIAFAEGPDLGPYQVGVLSGLVENLPAEEIAYTTVSGVSLGALNAHILSQFEVG